MSVRFVTRTAILLALTVAFQVMGRYLTPYMGSYNNFVVGPLVNACLLIATAFVGIQSGIFIAIAAPFGAILSGAAIPHLFAPFIATGNVLIVLGFYLLMKKNQVAGVITGAFLKFAFLWGAIYFMAPVLTSKLPVAQASKMAATLLFSFSWPQLVTALVGGVLATIVIKALRRHIGNI